jgi:hypothetical protein
MGLIYKYQTGNRFGDLRPTSDNTRVVVANLPKKILTKAEQEEAKQYKIKELSKALEIAQEKAAKVGRIRAANKAQAEQGFPTTRQEWADQTQAIGDKISLQNLPVVGEYVPGILDVTGGIGSMASSLASAPLKAQQENSYMPYLTGVGAPLLGGALAGIGAKTTGQFVNNVVNPFAGIKLKPKKLNNPVIENVNAKLNVNKNVDLDLVADKPWTINQPQNNTLQIKSTMLGSPLEKQLSKTGEINVNNIKAHIGKADVGQQDKFILDKVLNERFAGKTKIDYNEFRKAVSEELVPLEKSFDDAYSAYGVDKLGYAKDTKAVLQKNLDALKEGFEATNKSIKELEEFENNPKGFLELYKGTDYASTPIAEVKRHVKETLEHERGRLNTLKNQILEKESGLKNMPLENTSIIYGNKAKFGKGNTSHFADEGTLGHARTLVSNEEPDVMHILEQQSDYFQKNEPLKLTEFNLERWKNQIAKNENSYASDLEVLKSMKETRKDFAGNPMDDFQINQFEDIVNKKGKDIILRKGTLSNPIQKEYLRNTHQERLLQENMLHAAEQGKSKMRYPTSETAAKIQGYQKSIQPTDLGKDYLDGLNNLRIDNEGAYSKKSLLETIEHELNKVDESGPTTQERGHLLEMKQQIEPLNEEDLFPKDIGYLSQHKTILKKYDDTPKMIKKVLGKESKIVTDSRGNSWYEFDIPDAAKKGKFEMKALSLTGAGALGANAIQEKRKGGLIYKK